MKRFKLLLAALLMGVSTFVSAQTIEMDVNGLVCAFCAQGIEKTLKTFPATAAVYVSLEDRIVAVKLKDGTDIDDETLRKAIKEDLSADREKRIRFAELQTWDDVAAGISERIRGVVSQ